MDRIQQAEEALKEAEGKVKQRYRLGYHIMPGRIGSMIRTGLFSLKENTTSFFSIIRMMSIGADALGTCKK